MASLMSLYSGSTRRRFVPASGVARRSAAPMRQLLTRLRSGLRRSAARPRRAAALRFAYDLHSYSQNFDDGLGSSAHHMWLARNPASASSV